MQIVDHPAFQELVAEIRGSTSDVPCRQTLTASTLKQARSYREQIVQKLKEWNEPVTIAIDGWTNVNHSKVSNMLLLARGKAFFWKSLVNADDHNTAKWLSDHFTPLLNDLKAIGIKFAGIALDNEATQNAFFDLLQDNFPFLLHVPCSAHIIQLVARSILDHVTVRKHIATMERCLQEIGSNKELRLSIRKAMKADNVNVVLMKPNATRWNSVRNAAQRFIRVKKYIAAEYIDDEAVSAPFWQTLEAAAVVLLLPFQSATDDVQRDSATLMTFYNAFVTTKNSLRQIINANGILKLAAEAGIAALDDKWQQYVDDNLETCIRILLYGKNAIVDGSLVHRSQRWLFSWAHLYFTAMGIVFGSAENMVEDKKTVETHLKNEFGKLKTEDIEGDVGWRTWWLLSKERYPHLYPIAVVLLSLSPTEAAVERSFSKQGFIHSDRRNRSSDSLIEAQMMISFNHENLFGGEPAPDPEETQVLLDIVDEEEETKMSVEPQPAVQTTVNQFFRSASMIAAEADDAALAEAMQEEELTSTSSRGRRVRQRME